MVTGTVSKIGNSRGVVLPVSVVGDDFAVGTHVEIERLATGEVLLRSIEDTRRERSSALERLESFLATQPHVPWDDDSRESDRALAGGRGHA